MSEESASPSFADILRTNADEFKRPPTLPQGYYLCMVGKQSFDKSSKKQTPLCRYEFKPQQACEDVAQADLEGINLDRTLSDDFYLTAKATYRLTEFLRKCGLNVEGRELGEVVPEATGCMIKCYVNERLSQQPGSSDKFNEITAYAEAQ